MGIVSSRCQTPEGSFILKGSIFTPLSGEDCVSSEAQEGQSSKPARIAAVTWTAGDVVTVGEDLSQHASFRPPPPSAPHQVCSSCGLRVTLLQ